MTDLQSQPATKPSFRSWQLRIFWSLWLAYASYYLCRVNFSVAQPEILKEFPDWTTTQIGLIPSAFSLCYAIGQMINGAICQTLGARRLMTLAMILSAAINLAFAYASTFSCMLMLWAINGLIQSAGWAPLAQTMTNWTHPTRRATWIGFLSTCYTVGHIASWFLAGYLCSTHGWRLSFLIPSLTLCLVASLFVVTVRDSPHDVGYAAPAPPLCPKSGMATGRLSIRQALSFTLRNPTLWALSIGYFCMNGVRYSFTNWTVQYLTERYHLATHHAAYVASTLPLGGVLGSIFACWASDAWFQQKREPLCVVMLTLLTFACLAFQILPSNAWLLTLGLCFLIGFLINGPDILMSGAATIDTSHPHAVSTATGMIMCLGNLGAIFSGTGIGWLIDLDHGGWRFAYQCVTAMVIATLTIMSLLWFQKTKNSQRIS